MESRQANNINSDRTEIKTTLLYDVQVEQKMCIHRQEDNNNNNNKKKKKS